MSNDDGSTNLHYFATKNDCQNVLLGLEEATRNRIACGTQSDIFDLPKRWSAHDKIWKIRPVIASALQRYQTIQTWVSLFKNKYRQCHKEISVWVGYVINLLKPKWGTNFQQKITMLIGQIFFLVHGQILNEYPYHPVTLVWSLGTVELQHFTCDLFELTSLIFS